ncbi:MAG: nucleotide exchange factor GrpE [Bacteroidales bacterium]|nr:nucleotide exchange factor GrpE [Bacteroidales bacterium]
MSKHKNRHHSDNKNVNKQNIEMEQNSEAQKAEQQAEETANDTEKKAETDTQSANEEQKADNSSEVENSETDNQSQENGSDAEEQQNNDFEAKYNELNDKYLRLMAEFDNYRKRTLKEKMDLTKFGGEGVLKGILPVVDNMERAIKAMATASDMDAVKEGINLIYNKFTEFLTKEGLKEIEAQGLELDTDKHEAVTKFPAPSEDLKGKIIDVIEKGYTLNDKVIRYAKVVVGE